MNKQSLQNRLKNENIPQDFYSLCGGLPNEAYCLNFNESEWETYYSEKGLKTGLKKFSDEESACQYFYDWFIGALKNMGML